MKITTKHPQSSYGQPVILDDSGAVMDYAPGVRAVRESLGLTRGELAQKIGIPPRTIESWEQKRRTVSWQGLYRLGELLRASRRGCKMYSTITHPNQPKS